MVIHEVKFRSYLDNFSSHWFKSNWSVGSFKSIPVHPDY